MNAKFHSIIFDVNQFTQPAPKKFLVAGLEEEAEEEEEHNDKTAFCLSNTRLVMLLHFRPTIKPHCFLCRPVLSETSAT